MLGLFIICIFFPVCVKAKELIDAVEGTPLFDLKELNSKLYTNVKQIEDVKVFKMVS